MRYPERNGLRPRWLALAGLFILLPALAVSGSSAATLARGFYPRASTAELDPQVKLGDPSAAPAANLARSAKASAFESYQGMTPDLAVDGVEETRWSGVPGHNEGGWFELAWDRPVRIAEVVVVQHGRYVNEMDLRIWDEGGRDWTTLRHFGKPETKLPRIVTCDFEPRTIRKLRFAAITGGPSFLEVKVYERPATALRKPVVALASDADGGFIGMVCDERGDVPFEGAAVILTGRARRGEWRETAKSGSNGVFYAPMPAGLSGTVAVSARVPSAAGPVSVSASFEAEGFQYGLIPENLLRPAPKLDGRWRFAPDPPADFWKADFDDRGWGEIAIPAHFEMEGFHPANGVGGYRLRFNPPQGAGRLKLRFEGVYSGAEAWLNGRRLAAHEGGALPFEMDLTDAARSGENVLAVRAVQTTPVSVHLDKMSEYADFPLAGIMRSVRIYRVPEIHVGAAKVWTEFDASFRDAVVKGRLSILNESNRPASDVRIGITLVGRDGRTVAAGVAHVSAPNAKTAAVGPWSRAEFEFSVPVSNPEKWDAEHPRLYTLAFDLQADGRSVEPSARRIGFRQTDIRDGRLLINGQAVKIRGTCHHDSHPLMGRAVTAALTRLDLTLMKEANLNALRTSHYPPIPELLDFADELGIYVEDEGSFCWADAADDLRLAPRLMQLNAELLARDRNHPSVFLWSVCNESDFGEGFERSREWIRAADPSRPDAGSYDRGSLDVLARHNPITISEIDVMTKEKRPVLWDESWCIYQGIWNDVAEMWIDPGIRDYYAEPLPAIYERMMRTPNIAGTQIWAWSDDIFAVPGRGLEYGRGSTASHFIENEYRLPGRGLVGDAPWGVVDGWRRKKPEFWITKKLHSPIKIKEEPVALPAPGEPIRVAVENQYDFADLSELTVSWRIGTENGRVSASVPPHSTGTLEIRTLKPLSPGDRLALEFKDAAGGLVDAYRLPLGKRIARTPELRGPTPSPLKIVRENYLAGPGIRVVGRDFELAFDQTSGNLRRAVVFGKPVLLEWPHLHVLPAAAPASPLPSPQSWHLDKLDVLAEGENIRARIMGRYDRFEGGYDIQITPEGEITVHSSFKYIGDQFLAREIGMSFSVPKDCDVLRWERRGDWSVYPEDHIGRTQGETRSVASHPKKVPPEWPFAQDNSPMGTNDFRSTKRRIDWASLAYSDGPGAWVLSDGTQHARAMVASDRIAFFISDWYGGTNCGLSEWVSNYGPGKPVAPGATIESTVRLRLALGARVP
jgi:beta-galactosidase